MDPSTKFDEVRRLRDMADRLREKGELGPEEYQQMQNELGAMDREYFAEEMVGDSPLLAVPLSLMIPAEYAAKSTGLVGGRSQPTFESVRAGYRGVRSGLGTAYENLVSSVLRKPQRLPDSPSLAGVEESPRTDPVDHRVNLQKQLLSPSPAALAERIRALRP